MPEPESIVQTAEAVEKAVEEEVTSSRTWFIKLKSAASFITACAAFVAALAAIFKPQDHTVTKNSYETLSESITKLADAEQKNHEDLANLRGYLDGLAHAPLAAAPVSSMSPALPTAVPSTTATATASAAAPLIPLVRVHTAAAMTSSTTPISSEPMSFKIVDQAGPVPTVHPATTISKPPKFDDVAARGP